MRRRRLLAVAGGSIAALSGCTTSGSSAGATSPPATATRTQSTTGEKTRAETSPASVSCTGETNATREQSGGTPAPNEALAITSCLPVSGPNVNVGVQGVAKNISGQWLVDCVVDVTGELGGETFHAQATRSPLSPHDTWEWEVPFGSEADSLGDDSPDQITIRTGAEYRNWDRDE